MDIARKSEIQGFSYGRTRLEWITKIIGHKPSHADILEALGEDWAMTGGYQLLRKEA